MVLINPTASTQSVGLGMTYDQVTPTGGGLVPATGDTSPWALRYQPVNQVSLAPNRAVLLLTVKP